MANNDIYVEIFGIHLYEEIQDKKKFYEEIGALTEFFEKNFEILDFLKRHLGNNKEYETAVRRLMQIIQISDPLGRKMFVLAVKIFKPSYVKSLINILQETYIKYYLEDEEEARGVQAA